MLIDGQEFVVDYEGSIIEKVTDIAGIKLEKVTRVIDNNSQIAWIPNGFKISQEPTKQTIDDGLVIIDKNEMEFVWIPVNDINEIYDSEHNVGKQYSYTDNGLEELQYENHTIMEPMNISSDSEKLTSWTENLFRNEFDYMIQSIDKYKGFYIAANRGGYYMSWYSAYNYCKNYDSGSSDVTNGMLWNCQYDAIARFFITGKNANPANYLKQFFKNTSKCKNIIDLSGNGFYTWTMAKPTSEDNKRVIKGGGKISDMWWCRGK